VRGLGYELLVLGLWLIITRKEDSVGVGKVVVVWLIQGRRNILCL
jgi:hypothetical protein